MPQAASPEAAHALSHHQLHAQGHQARLGYIEAQINEQVDRLKRC